MLSPNVCGQLHDLGENTENQQIHMYENKNKQHLNLYISTFYKNYNFLCKEERIFKMYIFIS